MLEDQHKQQLARNISKNINPKVPLRNIIPSQRIAEHILNLWRHSVRCLWEVSMRCPCVSASSNSPKPDCPICHGQGYFYPQSYILDMGMQSDKGKLSIGEHSANFVPGTVATPQFSTASGIPSQNIKPGDRITVLNWTTPQEYIFNVTEGRLKDGVFLPYRTKKVTQAYIQADDGQLKSLDLEKDLELSEDNFLHILNDKLLDKNITLLLNIEKRFYVESLLKELRYENFDRVDEKEWATGNGNKFVHFDQLKDGNAQYNGTQTFQLPNQLLLRREIYYFPNVNLVENNTDNNMVINDPTNKALKQWREGE